MTRTATILRFDPNGLNGLEGWEQMDYTSLMSGEPVQNGHLYHEVEDNGYMVGVWDCTAFTDQMMPYPVDEYMLFLEGSLAMILPDGQEIRISAGDAFVIPKGFVCQWKQNTYVRKYFMILDGPVPAADNPSLQRITVPDLAPDGCDVDLQTDRTDFLNAAGTMRVSVQTFGAQSRPAIQIRENRLITVLDGKLELYDGAESHLFGKGETAYIHQGDIVAQATSPGTRMITAQYAQPM